MKLFSKILFVSHGMRDEIESLKHAMSIARENGAWLTVLILRPDLPRGLADYGSVLDTSLAGHVGGMIQSVRDALSIPESDLPVPIEVQGGGILAAGIVQHVLRDGFDLVMKEAEPKDDEQGFKSMDMELLRKCPCAVWLGHPRVKYRPETSVGVAIDPQDQDETGRALSLKLLRMAGALADAAGSELAVIACWDYEYEEYLRDMPWNRMPEEEIRGIVAGARAENRELLDHLIAEAAGEVATRIHHVRGRPEDVIPDVTRKERIDVLVMGTVARTGIPGFIMGNTAEDVVQKLRCSLVALKPDNFVTPVPAG